MKQNCISYQLNKELGHKYCMILQTQIYTHTKKKKTHTHTHTHPVNQADLKQSQLIRRRKAQWLNDQSGCSNHNSGKKCMQYGPMGYKTNT